MPKIKLKIKKNNEKNPIWEGYGIKKDHKLIYYDGNTLTKIMPKEASLEIIRTNPDYKINLYLSSSSPQATYQTKQHHLELPISNVEIKNQAGKIQTKYQIEEELFELEIEYEVLK